MRTTTLVFVFSPENKILLCMKKRWFGVWRRNGAGGKVTAEETIPEAACRELQEETEIVLSPPDLSPVGIINFSFPEKPERDQECHIFTHYNYSWTFQETEEMKPQRWDIADIPYDEMRPDDKIRFPKLLAKQQVNYAFSFDLNGNILS